MKKWKDHWKGFPSKGWALAFTIVMFINIFCLGYDEYTGWMPVLPYIYIGGTILGVGLYVYAVIRDRKVERKEKEKYLQKDQDSKDDFKTDL